MWGGGQLFGRERELGELRAALAGAESGRGALVLLVGEPGIGKTRLADAFAAETQARGARVVWGRAWESGGAPACWPWMEALRPLVADGLAPALDARLAPLARLLPELAVGAPPPAGDPAQERFRLFDAVAALLAQVARARPLVVVLDDLHAADPTTLGLLRFLARGVHATRLVVVGTYRDVEARLSAEVGEALAKVAREGRCLSLGRLGRDDVGLWVAAEGVGDADAVFAATEGNPLFVAEMLRLARGGAARLEPADRLPDGVRDVIRERLAHLSAPSRAWLDAACVLGRAIDLRLAAELAEVPLASARDFVAELSRADVLTDTRDRTAFSHILIREVLYQELPAARRAELHARVGRLLAARDGGDEAASLAEAVHHLLAAVPLVPADEAITWARRAAARAARRLAFDEATAMLERALELLPAGRDAERCELLLELAAAQGGAGQATRGRETALAAAALARRLGDAEKLAHAALRCGAAFLVAVVHRELIALLEEALAALPAGDHPLRARLEARLAAALQPAPDPEHPIALARDAIAMARRVADEPTRLEVLVGATSAMAFFADPRERLPLDEELVLAAERAGDRVAVMRGVLRLVFDHLELGDVVSADRRIDEYDRLSRAADLPMLRWRAPMLRSMRALMDARFEASEALCAEAATIFAQVDDASAGATLAMHAAGRLWAARRLDALAEALPATFELVGRMADPIFARCFRVGMLARIGRAAEARAELDALVRHEPPLRGRPMLVWAADACLALGDAEAAAIVSGLLAPLAHRLFSWSPLAMVMEGPIAGWIERLDALAGRPAPAPAPSGPLPFELTREGEVWMVRAETTFRLRDSRGLQILAQLVAHPGREFHVTDLFAPPGQAGHIEDAGFALDAHAIAAYKQRLEDLRDAEAEATAHHDPTRAARAKAEIEAIADELARGVGLGGRARKSSSTAEKARVNVRQRLLDAMTRIGEHSPALAKHLRQAIRTGTFCCYDP